MKPEQLTERIQNATERLAALKAKELLRQLRAQQRAALLARRDDGKQKLAFGQAVVDAGLSQLHQLEVLGLLLDAKDRLPKTPETLAALRQRAGRFLALQGRLVLAERPEDDADAVMATDAKTNQAPGKRGGGAGKAPAWLATTGENSS
jgi:hypothetical protein